MRNKFLKLYIIFSSLILACSDNGPSDPDYSFLIGEYEILVELDEFGLIISSAKEVESSVLTLNGHEIQLNWDYPNYLDEWWSGVDIEDLPPDLEYSLGKNYEVFLNLNEKEYFGTIHLSDKPAVNWPGYDTQSEYSFSWELIDEPYQQTVYMNIFYGEDDFIEKYWHLDGSARSHTIKQKYIEKLNEPNSELWIDLSCYNYFKKDKFIIVSESWVSRPDFEGIQKQKISRKKYNLIVN